jgi:hypothetical protein
VSEAKEPRSQGAKEPRSQGAKEAGGGKREAGSGNQASGFGSLFAAPDGKARKDEDEDDCKDDHDDRSIALSPTKSPIGQGSFLVPKIVLGFSDSRILEFFGRSTSRRACAHEARQRGEIHSAYWQNS